MVLSVIIALYIGQDEHRLSAPCHAVIRSIRGSLHHGYWLQPKAV
jgi:hypothetical protein